MTGAGSLAIWTHHLKRIQFLDHQLTYYTRKAIKMGTGVQGIEAYRAAFKQGLAVLGGECPTVGLAGGYTQGGGHSALSSKHGLAANQTLKWEVVDGTGRLLRANRRQNVDLCWALSGGGGGTYGVVVSLTAKAHPDIPVSGATLAFGSEGISKDTYYQAIGAWHASLPPIVDAGAMSVHFFSNTTVVIGPVTAPGISKSRLEQLLEPYGSVL